MYEHRRGPTMSDRPVQAIWHVAQRCRELRGVAPTESTERYTGGHEITSKNVVLCASCAAGPWKQMVFRTSRLARKIKRLRFWRTAGVLAWPAIMIGIWLSPSAFFTITPNSPQDMFSVPQPLNLLSHATFITAVIQGIVIAITLKRFTAVIREWQRLWFLALVERISWRYMSMVCNKGDFGPNRMGIPVNQVKIEIITALLADMKIVKSRCTACFSTKELFRLEALIEDVERWMNSMQEDAKRAAPLNPQIFRTAAATFIQFSVNIRKSSGFGHMSMGTLGARPWVGSQAARDAKVI